MAENPDSEEDVGVLIAFKDAALTPLHVAVSPRAQRAYLSTVLFGLAAIFLLGLAATAYIAFYFSYIPIRGFTQPVYFQFDANANPYASIPLRKEHLVTDQPYDVAVSLYLPRTPSNTAVGNFMIDLQLLAPADNEKVPVTLAHERRPAILTYYSPIMEHVHKAMGLPWYILGWRQEAEKLETTVMEGIEFAKGWRNMPATARIELTNSAHLHIYSASISFKAKLRGLRYLMYTWRLTSFVIFTSIFWGVELTTTAFLWLMLSLFLTSSTDEPIKKEEKHLSIKEEPGTASEVAPVKLEQKEPQYTVQDYPPATEADVEDEEEPEEPLQVGSAYGAARSDSGLGTSLESSSTRTATVRKRSSRSNLGRD